MDRQTVRLGAALTSALITFTCLVLAASPCAASLCSVLVFFAMYQEED